MMKRLITSVALGIHLSSCMQVVSEAPAVSSVAPAAGPRIIQSEYSRPADLGDTRLKGVRFIGKTVSDIDTTLAFYQQSVPFDLVHRYKVPANDLFLPGMTARKHEEIEVALVRTATVFVQLIDFEPNSKQPRYVKPPFSAGYTHICFHVI